VFLENDTTDLHQIFFKDLGENTCIEKHCTRPLNPTVINTEHVEHYNFIQMTLRSVVNICISDVRWGRWKITKANV